jgi:hypothetical protein
MATEHLSVLALQLNLTPKKWHNFNCIILKYLVNIWQGIFFGPLENKNEYFFIKDYLYFNFKLIKTIKALKNSRLTPI